MDEWIPDLMNGIGALDKKDFLILLLLLLITWLILRQQRREATTTQANQTTVIQEITPRQVPSISIKKDLSVSSTGNSALTAGILQVDRLTVEHVQDNKEPPPDLKLILGCMQAMLRKRYKDDRIQGLPWLREVSFTLEKCYVHLALTDQRTTLELKDLFHQMDNLVQPKRILVEGAAGFGKTTLARKLCNDWANNVDYMTCFDLVIILHLRSFKNDFNETLGSTVGGEIHGNIDAVLQTIAVNAHKTLLVLEGYDEAPPTAEKYLLPILRRDKMKHVTVLVTSRPGKFMAGSVFCADAYDDIVEDFSTYLDKKITIVGLLQEHQQIFLEKHLSHLKGYASETLRRVKYHLDNIVPPDFLACPLFLLMLVSAVRCGDTTKVVSKTDLFKLVFNFIVRRYLSKSIDSNHGKSKPFKVDIFNYKNQSHPEYVTALSDLGELAINALENDRLVFTQEELLSICDEKEMLLNIGLLNPTVEVNGIWNEIYFEPVHKSLLEFLAAYSLWISYRDNPASFGDSLHSKNFIRPTQDTACSSLVYPFLCGLFGNSSSELFKCLVPYSAEYSYWFGSLCFSLQECNLTPVALDSLKPLFPVEWRIPWYDTDKFSVSSNHQTLLQYALWSGKTRIIRWFLESPASFPKAVQVTILVLVVGAQRSVRSFSDNTCRDIRCSELWCDLRTPHSSTEDWKNLMYLVARIKKDSISFILCTTYSYLWLPFVCQAALNHEFGVSKLHWLHCWIKRKQRHTLSLISTLIETENLSGLNLLIVPSNVLAPLFDIVRCAMCSVTTVPVRTSIAQGTAHASSSKLPVAVCTDNNVSKSNQELLPDNVSTNDLQVQCLIDNDNPLHNSQSNSECGFYQDTVLSSILQNAKQILTSVDKLVHFEEGNQQSIIDTLSACASTTAVSSHSHNIQQTTTNSCDEFGFAATDYIASLKRTEEVGVSLQENSSSSTMHDTPMFDDTFGSSTSEFISSIQLPSSADQSMKNVVSLSNASSATATDEMTETIDSLCLCSSLISNNADRINSISEATKVPHASLNVNHVSCNKCKSIMKAENETCLRTKKSRITTEPQEVKTLQTCSTSSSCLTANPASHLQSLNNPSLVTAQDFSLLSLVSSWTNTFDVLSTDFSTLLEELGFSITYTLENCFAASAQSSSKVEDILESTVSVVNNHVSTVYHQTRNFLKNSSFFVNVYKQLFSVSSLRNSQCLSKMENMHKLVSLLYSFLAPVPGSNWLKSLPDLSAPNSDDDVSKQMACLFRQLASRLNIKVEPASTCEAADDNSKLDQLLLTLRSMQPMLSSIFNELSIIFRGSHHARLKKARDIIQELFRITVENFGPYFIHPSETRTLSIDSLRSILEKFEALSASILPIIEDTTSISKFINLMQPVRSKVHSVLLLFADLVEHIDETNVDINQLESLKDGTVLLFSFISSVIGVPYQTTPTVSKTLNSIVNTLSLVFPTVIFVFTILFQLCEAELNELMGPAAFQQLLKEGCDNFYFWTSSVLQLPPSTKRFSIEWLLFLLNPVKFGTSSTHLNLSAANLQRSSSQSNEAYDFTPISQTDFDCLIAGASYSQELKNLCISNLGTLSLDIDADTLFNGGEKSWNELKITGDIQMQFNSNTLVRCKANHLYVRTNKDAMFREPLLSCFHSESFHCSQQLLTSTLQENYPLTKNVTELNISLMSSPCNVVPLISSMKHIQTLGFTLESFDEESFSVEELLAVFATDSVLKRFELWNVHVNPKVAGIIVEAILEHLMTHQSDRLTTPNETQEPCHNHSAVRGESLKDTERISDTNEPHIECLMLHVDVDILRFKTFTSIMNERFKQTKRLGDVRHIMERPKRRLLDIVADIKLPLTENRLTTLQLVSMCKPPDWREIFRHDEGFSIDHSMLRKQIDTNRNTSESDLIPFMGHQFSVGFQRNKR